MAPKTPEKAKEIAETNDRVWEMVLYRIHPCFLYVVLEIVIASRLAAHPASRSLEWPLYGAHFLGAWAVFYSTLLRNAGFRSVAGPALVLFAAASLVVQYFVFPDVAEATTASVRLFHFVQGGTAAAVWAGVFVRWLFLKRVALAALAAEEKGR